MSTFRRVTVELLDRSYPVVVGDGAQSDIVELIPEQVRRVAVVSQSGIPMTSDVVELLGQRFGSDVVRIDIGREETDKSMSTVEEVCRNFARIGLTRRDLVIGVGGGLVTDVAGFAASIWHRGTPVLHVATTLLAMVDAAIGGKTGVNLPQGKNLVGSFWQPIGVICDLDALETLSDREMRCGRGEISKYHFLTGEDLLALELDERISRCVEIKADVVAGDEREDGRRALLNYGHTLAHAIETVGGHSLAHGEAVAVGLAFAAQLARDLGRIDESRVEYHRHVIEDAYGLSAHAPTTFDPDELIETMRRDKKAVNGLTFVLDSQRGVEVVEQIDVSVVRRTLTAFLES